jgi:hypothetical protein
MIIPFTAALAPVEESVLIRLLVKLICEEVFAQVIAVTAPPVPVEDKVETVLDETVIEVALFAEEPIVIPVIELWPLIFEMALFDKVETPFQ